ncbi:NERD domain-containing protein [Cytobacillus suaedae]|nr:NERD domain-containing protein [Cytobacillus suaedae]
MVNKSKKVYKLEALLRRLSPYHEARPKIEEELAITKAGDRGEQSLDYHLKLISIKNSHILRGIRLRHFEDLYFQMDTLILTKRFILNLDAKNMSGTLFFDRDFDQLIRTSHDGKVEAFLDPILQVKRQELQLKSWLKRNKYPPIPIISLVLITNPSSIIKADPQHIKSVQKVVIHSANFPFILESFDKSFQKEILTSSQVNKLSKHIIKENTPLVPDYLEKFKIRLSDLLTGVYCSTCNMFPLIRRKKKWFCPSCKVYSGDAHIETLIDYYFLKGETITSKECREFLQIKSKDVSCRLLASLELEFTGNYKGRVYHLSSLINRLDWR